MPSRTICGALMVLLGSFFSPAQAVEIVCDAVYVGSAPTPAEALYEAYAEAEQDLADKIADLRAGGAFISDAYIEVTDATHLDYNGSTWWMGLTVRLHVEVFPILNPPFDPWNPPFPWIFLP